MAEPQKDTVFTSVRLQTAADEPSQLSPLYWDAPAQTVSMSDAAVTLSLTEGATNQIVSNTLYVDPESSGTSENLLLPAEADADGLTLKIVNTGGEGIQVQNDAGGNIILIPAGEFGTVVCDGTTWRGFIGLDAITVTSAEVNKLDGLGANAYVTVTEGISFTEAGDTTYTGTVEIPAGAVLQNIQVVNTVLWDDSGAVTMVVGDDDDPNGWFDAVNMKATDLLVGEVLQICDDNTWGGVDGVYLNSTTGRRGRTTAGVDSGPYYGAASEVIGVITTTNQDGSAGRSFMFVTYAVPTVVAATGA